MARDVTIVYPGGGVGPVAKIDEGKTWYVAQGFPPGVPPARGLTPDQVSTVVSTDGAVVCVLGHFHEVYALLLGGRADAG